MNVGNRPLRIALGAGHRNTSGGNEFETALNGQVVNHLVRLARESAGFEVRCYTPNDGLGMYPGPLDAAAAQVRSWRDQGWAADILHEVHFQGIGTSSLRGAFVIYPDSAGLRGRNPGNVDLDVKAEAGAMAKILADGYGGVCWYSACSRGMSERETGVGIQGYRLGVFGAWADEPFISNAFQMITEGGTFTNSTDLALMKQPDFPAKHARSILEMYAYLAKKRANWTYPYKIGSAPGPVPQPTNLAPDGLPYPSGLDSRILENAFGVFVGPAPGNPQFRYAFNATGPISKFWYARGKTSGKFPAIKNSFVDGNRWYLFYSDGSVQWRADSGDAWKWL